MIEIIREEEWDAAKGSEAKAMEKTLPKDIKQIGRSDIGDRIYVENQVYHFLHPYDSQEEKTAYVLLGRFENYNGRQCTFVESAVRLDEIDFEGELPLWSDHTWSYIYKQMKKERDNMVIVGWAMDIKGQLPNMTVRLEALHQKNFGGLHQVLFLMDTLESEEAFYGSRNGHLYRREGFYIYYDKKASAKFAGISSAPEENLEKDFFQKESAEAEDEPYEVKKEPYKPERNLEMSSEPVLEAENFVEAESGEREPDGGEPSEKRASRIGSYRQKILEQEEKTAAPSYASSLALLAVVCVLGFTAFRNYQKMNAMEETLAQMNGGSGTIATEQTETQPETEVKIESVAGNVQAQEGGQDGGSMENVTENGQTAAQPGDQVSAELPAAEGAEVSAETQPEQNGQENQEAQPGGETSGTPEESAPTMTEAQSYLAQGYYIVQKGDSLVGICKKIYQTTAMMDKLCEVNDIEDKNAIYAGQYLTLPN